MLYPGSNGYCTQSFQLVPSSNSPRRQKVSGPMLITDFSAAHMTSPGTGEEISSSCTTTLPASGKQIFVDFMHYSSMIGVVSALQDAHALAASELHPGASA